VAVVLVRIWSAQIITWFKVAAAVTTRGISVPATGDGLDSKPEHAPLVTERMIKETTLTGSAEELQTRIRKMAAMGVKQVAITGGQGTVAEFATQVIHAPN
jgi:diacylglycerol kinase family enzyme